MKKEDMSCIDCAVKNCNKMDKTYPDFCLTTHMDEEVLNEAMECYNEDENRKVTIAAADAAPFAYCIDISNSSVLTAKLFTSQIRAMERGSTITPVVIDNAQHS